MVLTLLMSPMIGLWTKQALWYRPVPRGALLLWTNLCLACALRSGARLACWCVRQRWLWFGLSFVRVLGLDNDLGVHIVKHSSRDSKLAPC
jgi:hypothetical protein